MTLEIELKNYLRRRTTKTFQRIHRINIFAELKFKK